VTKLIFDIKVHISSVLFLAHIETLERITLVFSKYFCVKRIIV